MLIENYAPYIRFGEFSIDVERRNVYRTNHERLDLLPKDVEVMVALVRRPNQCVTRDELMNLVWLGERRGSPKIAAKNRVPSGDVLTNCISRIRKKTRSPSGGKRVADDLFVTEHLMGYKYVGPQPEYPTHLDLARGPQSLSEPLPADDELDLMRNKFALQPSTIDDIEWSAQLATRCFPAEDCIPKETKVRWFRKNPLGFWTIHSPSGRVGNLHLLPIKPRPLNSFVIGGMRESDLTEDHIFAPTEAGMIEDIYAESFVAIRNWETTPLRPNPIAAWEAIREFERIMRNLADPSRFKHVYALAASPNGTKLLKDLAFEPYVKKEQRLDKHDMYRSTHRDLVRELSRFRRS